MNRNMQPNSRTNIPFLEIPNSEEIEKNINESSLVLCLSLSEKEPASLLAPCSYYLCVNRYMFLSNIVPKCVEYFKTIILPLYGNKCGIYFEIDRNHKKRKKHFNTNEFTQIKNPKRERGKEEQKKTKKGTEKDSSCDCKNKEKNYKENECERIVLDWRLPIGVLFDIYCEFEEDEEKNEEEMSEEEMKTGTNTKTKEDSEKVCVVHCKNNELVEDCCSIVECIRKEDNLKKEDETSMELKSTKEVEPNKCISEFVNEQEEYMKNTRGGNHNTQFYKLVKKEHITNLWYQKKFINMSQKNIPWKLRVCFKSDREYCHVDFLHTNKNKNYVDKINLLPYNSYIPLYKGIHDFEEFIMNQLLKASQIYKRSNRTIQKLSCETETEMLFHLKNFNVEKICAMYRRYIYYNLLQSVESYNNILRENAISGNNTKEMNTNICSNTENFTNESDVECENCINGIVKKKENDVKEPLVDVPTISKEDENRHENNNNNDKHNNNNNNNACDGKGRDDIKYHTLYNLPTKETKKQQLFDLLKKETMIDDLPIIIHIYGPPYNQVVTKFRPFRIQMAENDGSKLEEFYIYTLGDFLHEQFPDLFRKITKKNNRNEKMVMGCNNSDSQNRNRKDPNVANNYNNYDKNHVENVDERSDNDVMEKREEPYLCSNDTSFVDIRHADKKEMETIHYFKDDNFLIFSEYIFVIINGIQVPLDTPLYWLAIIFPHFDSFLHIILRVPSY